MAKGLGKDAEPSLWSEWVSAHVSSASQCWDAGGTPYESSAILCLTEVTFGEMSKLEGHWDATPRIWLKGAAWAEGKMGWAPQAMLG